MNDLLDKSQKTRKEIRIMSRIIRTSSGVKFPSKEDIFLDEQAKIAASKKLSMLAREKKEQAEFAEKYLRQGTKIAINITLFIRLPLKLPF